MSPARLRYEIKTYKLDNARSDEEWSITGGLVHAIKATSRAAELKVRINAIQNPQITISKGDSVETRVTKLYITNAAQAAESIDLLVVPNPEVLKVLQGAEIGDIDTIGTLGSITAPVDISDRVARLLGEIKKITDPVDVSDRVARQLGVIKSITDPVTVSSAASETFRQYSRVITTRRVKAESNASQGVGAFTVNLYTVAALKVLDLSYIASHIEIAAPDHYWFAFEAQFGGVGNWHTLGGVHSHQTNSRATLPAQSFPPGSIILEAASVVRATGNFNTATILSVSVHGWLLDEADTS